MSQVWDPSISALRRRVLAAGALDTLGKVALPASLFALLYLGLTTVSPWARFFAPWVGGLLALSLVGATVAGLLRARHSDLYLAKWIDKESGLDDRLASAVEWSRLELLDSFQRRCIEQLSLQLGARRWALVLPRTMPERWPITFAALLVIACTPLVFLRRPHPPVERDAHSIAVLLHPVAKSAAQSAIALGAEAKASQDAELEKISTDLGQLLQNIDQGKSTREDSFRQLDRLRAQISHGRPAAGALARMTPSSERGPVGALSRALAGGDRAGTQAALGALSSALGKAELSSQQLDELRANLQALSELAKGTPGAGAELSGKIDAALEHVAAGDQAAAGQQLSEVQKGVHALDKALASVAAMRKAEGTIERVTRALEGAGETAEPSGLRAAGGDGTQTAPPELTDQGGGAGLSGQKDGRVGGGPAAPSAGPELAVRGTWNGKVMRQFFDSSSSAAGSEEVKKLLVEHERVVTNRLDRDEIPLEYQEAVRAYFAALHQKGR